MALMQLLGWLNALVPQRDEEGQGGLEYALVAGVVVVAIILAFNEIPIGKIVTDSFAKVQALITGP